MAAKEIKQRIVLEGEKQYNAAIKEAQRNLRTLKSELKAETAELGRNATEQQKAETRAKSLKQQIAEQEKIVKTLREALEQAKEQYGDNAEVVARWEQRLNESRATLASMKNDLDGVGAGMRGVKNDAAMGTVAAKSFADSISRISEAGQSVSDGIEGIFRGMVDTVRSAISEVWAEMTDLAGRANGWVDLAGFWNTDAKTIQTWSHAVQGAHDSFEDLNNAVTRINMGDQKKIAAATGVSGENYEDKWKYAMAVMDAMANMDYEEKLAAAGEVFGEKRATKVLDLLNDWDTIRENVNRFDDMGMTEEQIEEMSSLAEKIDTLKETWAAFVDSFEATHMGKLTLDLVGNAQRILDDLIKYLDSGSDEDLAKLEEDITAFFDRIKVALENAAAKLDDAGKTLQESDNGIVKLIGKAMSDLAAALEWISKEENMNLVVKGFETLAAFWLVGQGAKLIGSIAGFVADLRVIQGFNVAGTAGSAVSGMAGGGLGGSIVAALSKVVLPVSLAAILCYPVLEKLIHGDNRTPEEQAVHDQNEKAQEIGQELIDAGAKPTEMTSREKMEYMMTGRKPQSYIDRVEANRAAREAEKAAEEAAREAAEPRAYVESSGPLSPVRRARFNATPEQQAAVNNFWDVWRSGEWGENDESYDSAWDAMETAFAGNEKEFERLNTWLDRMMEQWNSAQTEKNFNPAQWQDIPATWWTNPSGDAGNNGVTAQDLQDFRTLPSGIQQAVQAGASAGISGIQVRMDGRAVGELVAPYVSRAIARDIQ